MRPEILNKLFSPVSSISGVGPKTARLIEECAGPLIVNLLWHLPTGLISRKYLPHIKDARPDTLVIIKVNIEKHEKPPTKRLPYKVHCSDSSGKITLIFFKANEKYIKTRLPPGEIRVISGKLDSYKNTLQIVHPDHITTEDRLEDIKQFQAIYPLTASLTLNSISKAIDIATQSIPELPEWSNKSFIDQNEWPSWKNAIIQTHQLTSVDGLDAQSIARQRLAYDELLANQIALGVMRSRIKTAVGRKLNANGTIRKLLQESLPFTLTEEQNRAIKEISDDLTGPSRMLRLLQGDVGSGKTVVALFAMLIAVEAGAQAAFMVPTELLARQHYKTIQNLLLNTEVKIELLVGKFKKTERDRVQKGLADGTVDIVVGTHALFQDSSNFNDLAFIVVDEQHRFGVHQRMLLAEKGRDIDVLVMTATPIPRTLMLTTYGELKSSKLMQKPKGRIPILTKALPSSRLKELLDAIGRALREKNRVYWVCPLITESDVLELAPAEDRYNMLKEIFGNTVGIIHGQMSSDEKDHAMSSFANGTVNILVATTIIEVGIDVPEATIIVIEHAERFGLAQLHQLRGRVGRSQTLGNCILLYSPPLGAIARARLEIMRETNDGFIIAEEDLRLRGAGELLGTKQSGLPALRIADLNQHQELLLAARDDANLVLSQDPMLQSERGQALRTLLYLFERDVAVRYLQST